MSHGKHHSAVALRREGVLFEHLYRVLQDGRTRDIPAEEFNAKHQIDGIIRIPAEAYDAIDKDLARYTHFNLEFSGHRIGATYALAKIVTHGYFRSLGDERPPVISFDDILVARCVSVREHVPYDAIRDKDFRYASKLTQNIEDLKKEMLFHYALSLPFLTKMGILDRGVSITTLRIIKRNQHLDI